MRDTVIGLLQQKRRLLRDAITNNILDFLFMRRTNKMMYEDRLVPLYTLIQSLMSHKFEAQSDISQQAVVNGIQNMLTSVARQSAEHTLKTKQLLKE
jgi:hypothetical protein